MSYNLLLDTQFKKLNKHWKLTNCTYNNGYLISTDKIYSIEQEIILPNPTKLYFGLDYICFDKTIKKLYCGIQIDDTLEVNIREPHLRRKNRISVVDNSKQAEKIKVKFIIESTTANSKIYIQNPLLIDLSYHNKDWWPRWMLNRVLDYRHGYNYENLYKGGCEIQLDNNDFQSTNAAKIEEAKIGIIAHIKEAHSFDITHAFIPDHFYLIKLDYEQLNKYGTISASYGQLSPTIIDDEQFYMIIKSNSQDQLKILVDNKEALPYMINLKHILIVDLTNLRIDEDDIIHLPFI